jgi:hypothetical protein
MNLLLFFSLYDDEEGKLILTLFFEGSETSSPVFDDAPEEAGGRADSDRGQVQPEEKEVSGIE